MQEKNPVVMENEPDVRGWISTALSRDDDDPNDELLHLIRMLIHKIASFDPVNHDKFQKNHENVKRLVNYALGGIGVNQINKCNKALFGIKLHVRNLETTHNKLLELKETAQFLEIYQERLRKFMAFQIDPVAGRDGEIVNEYCQKLLFDIEILVKVVHDNGILRDDEIAKGLKDRVMELKTFLESHNQELEQSRDGESQPSRGGGSQQSRGEGSQQSRGEGSQQSRGEGSQQSRGEGSQQSRGEGSQQSRGEGSQQSRGEGSQQSRGGRSQQSRDLQESSFKTEREDKEPKYALQLKKPVQSVLENSSSDPSSDSVDASTDFKSTRGLEPSTESSGESQNTMLDLTSDKTSS